MRSRDDNRKPMAADAGALQVAATALPDVRVITPPTIFVDGRGTYVELYHERMYREAGVRVTFVQDDASVSRRGVLRGIHGDRTTWKLVSCLLGEFYLVVVDCREDSPGFGQWTAMTLSEENHLQVLVPPGHGLAHLIMSERAVFHYKQSTYYDRASQFTYRWNDPRFSINWPTTDPILSDRDQRGE